MAHRQGNFSEKFSPPLFRLLFRVYGYLRPYWKLALGMYLFLLGIMALDLLIPQFLSWIIDSGIENANLKIRVLKDAAATASMSCPYRAEFSAPLCHY